MPETTQAILSALDFATFKNEQMEQAVINLLQSLDKEMDASDYTSIPRTMQLTGKLQAILDLEDEHAAENLESKDEVVEDEKDDDDDDVTEDDLEELIEEDDDDVDEDDLPS